MFNRSNWMSERVCRSKEAFLKLLRKESEVSGVLVSLCVATCAPRVSPLGFGGVFTMLPRGTATSDVLEICAGGISRVVSRGEDGVAQNTAVVERGDEMGCHSAFWVDVW